MKTVLIACAHEPELDPRIDWAARHAPESTRRIVLGFVDERRSKPPLETIGEAYTISRIRRDFCGSFDALCYLLKEALRLGPLRVRCFLALMCILALPLLLAYEAANFLLNLLAVLVRPLRWMLDLLRRGSRGLFRGSILARLIKKIANRYLVRFSTHRLIVFRELVNHLARTNAALLMSAKKLDKVDVVHVNDLETLPAGVLIKWWSRAELIFDSHEYWPYSDVESSGLEIWFWKTLERALVQHADHAVTVSRPLAEVLSDSYKKKFHVVPNCEPVTGRYNDLRPSVPAADGSVRFVYQGNFAPERGLEELILGWSLLQGKRAQLYLRGPQNEYRARCMALAQRLNVEGVTVHFPPAVLESELVATASQFDVGVIPYKPHALAYRYCCPNKLSQYMQASLAILTNDLIFVKEVVSQYRCGLSYNADSLGTLVDAVSTFAADRAFLGASKLNAKKAAVEHFNWQVQSKPLYDAYLHAA